MCLSHYNKIHIAKQDKLIFFNRDKNIELLSLNETFWMWTLGEKCCTFSWQKKWSLLRAAYMNLFFFSTWIQLFFFKKRESMPASSSKFFEHTHLKWIIFLIILFIAMLLRVGSPSCCTFQNNATYYLRCIITQSCLFSKYHKFEAQQV